MASKLDLSFSPNAPEGDHAIICIVGDGGTLLPTLDKSLAASVIAAMSTANFKGDAGKSLTLHLENVSVLLIGTGEGVKPGSDAEEVGGRIFSRLDALERKRAYIPDPGLEASVMADMLLGMMSCAYHFEDYFTESPKREKSVEVTVVSETLSQDHPEVADRMALMAGVDMARNLVFEPPNRLFPVEFAHRCAVLEKSGIEISVLDDDAMAELGMGALLGVGQGSRRESRMVVMNWRGGAEEAPIALVGKGVTFDTGGISLKPAKGMEDMKFDMGGAAAVTGTMMALAKRQVKRNVVGIIGLVENMPDGNAQRPGDVVMSMAGKTIEVINTDAEGRLVLADAMHYAQTRFKPQAMVDLATLTGAMIVALGKEYAGVFSNSDGLSEQLTIAGGATREPVWRMPLGKAYHQQLKSHIADMKNIGGPAGGSITAACFLERFVIDTPWAHLDIAGKAWADKSTKTVPKGGTGYGVRLLNRLIDDWQPVQVDSASES